MKTAGRARKAQGQQGLAILNVLGGGKKLSFVANERGAASAGPPMAENRLTSSTRVRMARRARCVWEYIENLLLNGEWVNQRMSESAYGHRHYLLAGVKPGEGFRTFTRLCLRATHKAHLLKMVIKRKRLFNFVLFHHHI